MKVRIGISAGGESLGPEAMVALARGIAETGFDSLWLPEVLTRPGPDPLVGLAWVSGACPGLKIGTTMLLPGRNLVWLAKAVATLDVLSGGRFLLTFVPGLAIGGERSAIGIPTAERGEQMDDALPVLRRLWAGEVVSHDGPAGSFADVSVSPRPVQDPFDVWLGGNAPGRARALRPAGRRVDPRLLHPGRRRRRQGGDRRVAAEHGRAISPEHFGVSLAYAPEGTDVGGAGVVAAWPGGPGAVRSRRSSRSGVGGLRSMLEQFLDGRVLQVHRAPDGAAGGVAVRTGASRRRGGRPADVRRPATVAGDPYAASACPSDPSPSWRCTPTPTTRPSARAASWPATPPRACARCWSRAPTASSATRPAG